MGLFLLATISIMVIVGFANSTDSVKYTVDKASEINNLEDGHFHVFKNLTEETREKIENQGINLEEDFYIDYKLTDKRTIRLFKERTDMNTISIIEGSNISGENEIVIDKHFGEKNQYDIGNSLNIDQKEFEITGYGITPEYTLVLSDISELLADPKIFGIGFIKEKAFEELNQENLVYGYAFRYVENGLSDDEKDDILKEVKNILREDNTLTAFYKTTDNQRVTSYLEKVSVNKNVAMVLGIVLLFLIAFIISISAIHIIDDESTVIGALYSLGFIKKEIVRHFLILPLLIIGLASILGTMLGFLVVGRFISTTYYNYFTLPNLELIYPAYLFVIGIVVPILITVLVNWYMLNRRLNLTPLQLLRRDIKNIKTSKIKLRRFSFLTKFQIRVLLREIRNNITLTIGLIFSIFLLIMGFGIRDSISNYVTDVKEDAPSQYSYYLKAPVDINNSDAEKGIVTTMDLFYKVTNQYMGITIQGIPKDSKYFDLHIDETEKGLYISNAVSKKFGINVGDTIELRNSLEDKSYKIEVVGKYEYINGLYVFMNQDALRELLEKEEGYYNVILSNEQLDIDENYIKSIVTADDIAGTASNMAELMKKMIVMLISAAVIVSVIVIYLLLKMIVDKSTTNISLIKIFGFRENEISKMYLGTTFYTVLIAIFIAIPIDRVLLELLWPKTISNVQGFVFVKLNPSTYILICLIIIITYLISNYLLRRHLRNISLAEVLKNRE